MRTPLEYKMNSRIIIIITAVVLPTSIIALPAYAKSSYDQDGFTIFPTKSAGYMDGYRAGVIQAYKDVQLFNDGKIQGIDARQDHITCPANSDADFCAGYKDGYSDEALDQLG